MKKSTGLFAILLVLLISVSGFANIVVDDYLQVPKFATAPVIDGEMDAQWFAISQTWMMYDVAGAGENIDDWWDLSGWFKMAYTDDAMYLYINRQDETIVSEHANTYEMDGAEIYFDGDNSKGETYDGINDVQWRFNYEHLDNIEAGGGVASPLADPAATEAAIADTDWGFVTEIMFPLEGLDIEAEEGWEFGFEMQFNDNDVDSRESNLKWWLQEGDASWNNASVFGNAVLTGYVADEVLGVEMIESAPTIDGEMDDVWMVINEISSDKWIDDVSTWDDLEDPWDNRFNVRQAYDADNLYLFIEAFDDILDGESAAEDYQQDSFEIYFDADNSKGETYDGVDDKQVRFVYGREGEATTLLPNVTFAQMDTEPMGAVIYNDAPTGYNFEMAIPLTDLMIEAEEGWEFGYEVQNNDNDGEAQREIMGHWWSNSNDCWANASLFGTAAILSSAVETREAATVTEFVLDQNYPNPFNPTTTISYSVPEMSHVNVTVFNALGKEVATLVNGSQAAGSYQVNFDAASMTSGVYFYTLTAGNTTLTQKMLLVK